MSRMCGNIVTRLCTSVHDSCVAVCILLSMSVICFNTGVSSHSHCEHHIPRRHEVLHGVSLEPDIMIRKREAKQALRIHLHFDKSIRSLPRAQRRLIQNVALPQATEYWERTLYVRGSSEPIRLKRRCVDDLVQYVHFSADDLLPYCVHGCLERTTCGDIAIPQDHLEACHSCLNSSNCFVHHTGSPGVQSADFILYVSALHTRKCLKGSTVAYSAHCQLEKALDRPVAGYFNICPGTISLADHDLHQTISTIKHEILHALGFTAGLYAFYRDKQGNPLTIRNVATNKPEFDARDNLYRWSERVVKTLTRRNWRVASGYITKNVNMIITPRVLEEVRRHFDCPTLEGAELEDQGIIGTAITHWEKRVFENEAMTGTYTQNPLISRITLALMEDTGWYNVNYEMADDFHWGKGLGCDFVKKSCLDWILLRKERHETIHPFCTRPREGFLHTECTMNRDSVGLCNLIEHPPSQPIPAQYQYFSSIAGITRANAHVFGGSVTLADYCPFVQEFTWKSGEKSLRTSKCAETHNNAVPAQNYLLEHYSSRSKCFEHDNYWSLKHCQQITAPQHGGSGCYQYSCIPKRGLVIIVNGASYPCGKAGQTVFVQQRTREWLHSGSIICPSCDELCKDEIRCPNETELPSRYAAVNDIDPPCFDSGPHQALNSAVKPSQSTLVHYITALSISALVIQPFSCKRSNVLLASFMFLLHFFSVI